ncbi:MAG TPA: hypothetical protein VNJ02_12560 [Vicinamibacterales bacterium]|nr:hypothetical protein [Vicinamibacterales bacterium]
MSLILFSEAKGRKDWAKVRAPCEGFVPSSVTTGGDSHKGEWRRCLMSEEQTARTPNHDHRRCAVPAAIDSINLPAIRLSPSRESMIPLERWQVSTGLELFDHLFTRSAAPLKGAMATIREQLEDNE